MAVVRAILLYAVETWAPREADVRRLGVADRSWLRRILGVSRTDRLSNVELHRRLGVPPVESEVTRRRWRFLGHVLRMPPDRVAPWMLRLSCTSEGGRRGRGASLLTWSRLVKKEGWDRISWAEIK